MSRRGWNIFLLILDGLGGGILGPCPGWVAKLVGALSCTPKVIGSVLVRAHTGVVGSIPGQGVYRRQLTDISLSYRCFSLSPFLSL